MNHIKIIPFILLWASFCILILTKCANPIAPKGGIKDEIPPVLDTLGSSENYQINFELQEIYFAFNEWVVVKDAFQQIVVSPPLATPLEVKPKGKGITVNFDEEEVLLENTTYTINFGEAIQDLNEGNPIVNFKYVFSTGPIIDSLLIRGKVKNATTGEPVEKVVVMLYDDLRDSVLYTKRPVYFSRTDESGKFLIENIREDSFILRVLTDENLNYLFDTENEEIGFLDSIIFITNDTLQTSYEIKVFKPEPTFRRTAKIDNQLGVIKFAYNLPIENRLVSVTTNLQNEEWQIQKDTLYIWHQSSLADSAQVILSIQLPDSIQTDTFEIKASTERKKRKLPILKMERWSPASQPLRTPSAPLIFKFSNPISEIDTSYISVTEDDSNSFDLISFVIDTSDRRKIELNGKWGQELAYKLDIFPGAFTDIFHQKNDTTKVQFLNPSSSDFGNLILTANGLDSTKQYILRLLEKEKFLASQTIANSTKWTYTYKNLPPKTYSVEFIEDLNKNKKWDTGNYQLRRQPERILKQELTPLRASWDVEAEIVTKWK